jgi:hypothetical protein
MRKGKGGEGEIVKKKINRQGAMLKSIMLLSLHRYSSPLPARCHLLFFFLVYLFSLLCLLTLSLPDHKIHTNANKQTKYEAACYLA